MEGWGGTEGTEGVLVELLDEEGAGEFGSGGSSGGGDGDGFCSSSSRLPSIRSSRDGRVLSRGLPRPNIRYCRDRRERLEELCTMRTIRVGLGSRGSPKLSSNLLLFRPGG